MRHCDDEADDVEGKNDEYLYDYEKEHLNNSKTVPTSNWNNNHINLNSMFMGGLSLLDNTFRFQRFSKSSFNNRNTGMKGKLRNWG